LTIDDLVEDLDEIELSNLNRHHQQLQSIERGVLLVRASSPRNIFAIIEGF
jgi:hypothetical protein